MAEMLDICDEEGHLTGQTMVRSEVHKTSAWHREVLVWVVNRQGEILLQRRAEHLGIFPGLWDTSVAGHVSAGDEPAATARREMAEEIGVTAQPDELALADSFADRFMMSYGVMHQEYDFVFTMVRELDPEQLELQAAEVLDVKWLPADELERELADPVRSRRYAGRTRRVYDIALAAARSAAGQAA